MMRRFLLLAALVLAVASPAAAEVPSTMTFQGVLTDDLGVLFPDGNYSLTLAIYSVASGGSALYTEAHPTVAVVNGGFSVILGSTTPIALPFDVPYWLGIKVGTDPELTPRVPLTSSPYALSLRLPFSGSGGDATTPTLEIRNPVGTSVRATNALSITDGALNEDLANLFVYDPSYPVGGVLRLDAPGVPSTMFGTAYLGGLVIGGGSPPVSEFAGAGLLLSDELHVLYARLTPTLDGAASLSLYRDPSNVGLRAFPLSGAMNVTVSGPDRSIQLRTSDAGDASVQLPADAISSAEMLDEPGATSVTQGSFIVALTSSVTNIASTTMDCPAAGYVLVLASCQFGVSHVNGTLSSGFCGVSDNVSSLPVNQDVALRLQAAMPTGTYAFPATFHGLFQVSAGSNTFYLLGQEGSGAQFTAEDIQLTAVYLPTAYGTVTPTIVAGGGGESDVTPVRAGLTASEVATDREASLRANRTRIENELAQMKARMQQLEAEVAAEPRVVPAVTAGQAKP